MRLSFVVPAHDEEPLVGETLAAIHAAARDAGEPYETIVVDDASTDATADVAARAGARVVPVNLRQIAAVRNAGASVATGDALLFVDADTLVNADVVRAAADALASGAVGGGSAVRFDEPTPSWVPAILPAAMWIYRRLRLAAGCFVFCTADAFRAVGGFDTTLFAGEEAIISRALGRLGRFVVLPEAVTTSGRKLRTHSARELLVTLLRLGLLGRRGVRDRSRLGLWYGPRKRDPRLLSEA